jgi:DUF4097 and DUF4098 domain-containing protein YvlB
MKTKVETVAAGAREFDVEIYHGDIAARATEQSEWEFAWSSDEAPVVERDGDTIRIRQRGEAMNPAHLNLRLSIPAGTEVVRLRTGSGRITGEGLRGQLALESGNGDLTLRASRGEMKLATANGQVQAIDVEGRLQVDSGNGDILLQDTGGEATLDTKNGRVEVTVPRSLALAVHSGHGDIHVGDGTLERLQAHTNAGTVRCSADLAEGQHRLATGHGDLTLRVARGDIELHTMAGRIAVSDARGQIHAHTGHGDVLLQATAGSAILETNAGRIEVKVPRELHLQARSGNGDLHIGDGSIQTLQVETKRGTVHCSANLGPATHIIANGHGDINLRSAGGESRLTTSAGKIEVQDAGGMLTAQSGNGDVLVRSATGQVTLQTNNGRIEVAAPRGARIHAHSGHGDVQIGDGSVLELQARTDMGRIGCTADLGPGRHELASGNGDVALKLRPDVRARLDAQTSFGQIHADFALVRVGRSGSMSFNGMRMVGILGAGEPEIEVALRTGRGQIEIRRKEEDAPRYDPAPTRPGEQEAAEPSQAPTEQRVLEVLQALARGEISLEEADSMLQGTSAAV